MTKPSTQIDPKVLALGCVLVVALFAAPAAAQEAGGETGSGEGDAAQPAAAPVEQPPPTPSGESSREESEPAVVEGGGESAPVADTSQGDDSSETEHEGEEVSTSSEDQDAAEEEVPRYFQFSHRFQGGIGFVVGSGYMFEVAYGGNNCYMESDPESSVCHRRSPVFFDFLLSFGVTAGLEILLEYRLGLLEERVTGEDGVSLTDTRPMAIGFGIRYFIGQENSRVKAFIGALLDVDFTSGLKVDAFLRPIFGLQVEIVRWVAFFIQASVNLSFVRSFSIAFDAGGGLQFRFP